MESIDRQTVKSLIDIILSKVGSLPLTLMEVCGTHTWQIYQHGLASLLPKNIRLLSGPGCPVCVSPQSYIDSAIELIKKEDIILTCFGDLLKVPGSRSSLEAQRAAGREIRVVYSPLEAVKIAFNNLEREVVFLAVGFETTAPVIALSVELAEKQKLKNFFLLQALRLMPPVLGKLLADEEVKIDGLILPGHVSTIIGVKPFLFLAAEEGIPSVIAGFEAGDIIFAVYRLLEMIIDSRHRPANIRVENLYRRAVKYEGNRQALKLIDKYFIKADSQWRGLGVIKDSGLWLKPEYQHFVAEERFAGLLNRQTAVVSRQGCLCGQVLQGKKNPLQCRLFKKVCTPLNPQGPCMVSQEGSCAAYYYSC